MRPALALLARARARGLRGTTQTREPDLVVSGDAAVPPREAPDRQTRGVRIATARLVFITHGQASDSFWNTVKRGITEARRQTGVEVSYRAPDRFSIERMRRYIDQAVADRPDGLVISLPDATALKPSIEAAVKADIPVITINSGSDEFRKLGVLAHVGQPEYAAGVEAGERMAPRGRPARAVRQPGGRQRRARPALPRPRRRAGEVRRDDEGAAGAAAGRAARAEPDGRGARRATTTTAS